KIILRFVADVLELANNIVRTKPDRTGAERRQSRNGSQFVFSKQLFREPEHIAIVPLAPLAFLNDSLRTIGLQFHVGTRTEKCVAANLLAAFDRLEQKGIPLASRDRKKSRNWRKQVRHNRLDHGDQR